MQFAVDPKLGNQVNPEEAYSGKNRYVCSVCKKPVHKRRADIRRDACFVHDSGLASPECDLFHLGGVSTSVQEIDFDKSVYSLWLHKQSSVIDFQKWRLELEIPIVKTGIGNFSIEAGHPSKIEKTLESLALEKTRHWVKPGDSPYIIKISGTLSLQDREMLLVPCKGLDRKNPTIFSSNGSFGRRITSDTPLKWGKNYFLVVGKDFSISANVIKAVTSLGLFASYKAFELALPLEPDQKLKEWIEGELNRSLAEPSVRLQIVFPISLNTLDGIQEVRTNSTAIIEIKKPFPLYEGTVCIDVHDTDEDVSEFPQLEIGKDSPSQFLEVPVFESLLQLSLENENDEPLVFKPSDLARKPLLAVSIEVCTADGKESLVARLGTDEVHRVEEGLRSGKYKIRKIECSRCIAPALDHFKSGELFFEKNLSNSLDAGVDSAKYYSKLIDRLNDIAIERGDGYRLDFGNLGSLQVNSKKYIKVNKSKVLVIGRHGAFISQQLLKTNSLAVSQIKENEVPLELVPMFRAERSSRRPNV